MSTQAQIDLRQVACADRRERAYLEMALIRAFEERVLELFTAGDLFGTTHACIGQEATAVAVMDRLRPEDVVFSNHRCHGHYLARYHDPAGLLAELMGKEGGVCAGRGGSQHLCRRGFYTNGVQGNLVPVAAGAAYAQKLKKTGAVVALFIGDGTLGEGTVYETFNLASLLSAPLLVVLEDNGWAQSTRVTANLAGSMLARAQAFGIETREIASTDVEELDAHFGYAVDRVRDAGRPRVEIVHCTRLCAHSKADDFRPAEEIAAYRRFDPLAIAGARLDPAVREQLEAAARQEVGEAERQVREMPFARLD